MMKTMQHQPDIAITRAITRDRLTQNDFDRAFEDLIDRLFPLLTSMGRDLPQKVRSLGMRVSRYGRDTTLTMIESSPGIIARVGFDGLEQITAIGMAMAQHCRLTAANVFKGSAGLIDGLEAWGGRHLALRVYAFCGRVCEISWKAAARMLAESRGVISGVGFEGLEKITEIAMRISPFCWLTAAGNFEKSLRLIDQLRERGKEEIAMNIFTLAAGISRNSWQMAVCLLENSPSLIDRIGYGGLAAVAGLGNKIARHSWLAAVEMIEKSSPLIDEMLSLGDASLVMDIFDCCSRAADQNWRIAAALLEESPVLVARIGFGGFEIMARQACELGEIRLERALSFIKAESREGSDFMDTMTESLDLAQVKPVLANYLNALLRYRVEIAPTCGHFTDGKKIFLPASVNDFGDRQKNFMVYKVFATHEEAHLEYGSFNFSLSQIPDVIEKIKARYDERA
jgi:hypothetical protein